LSALRNERPDETRLLYLRFFSVGRRKLFGRSRCERYAFPVINKLNPYETVASKYGKARTGRRPLDIRADPALPPRSLDL
jgi:hypothetical protein